MTLLNTNLFKAYVKTQSTLSRISNIRNRKLTGQIIVKRARRKKSLIKVYHQLFIKVVALRKKDLTFGLISRKLHLGRHSLTGNLVVEAVELREQHHQILLELMAKKADCYRSSLSDELSQGRWFKANRY